MKRIDSHQHFWQLSRNDYSWLTPELELLYKDYLPNDLLPKLKLAGIEKTVLVQAADTIEETQFMLSLANGHDFIAGVVGWVDMESNHAIEQLESLRTNPYFKGIRPMIQDIDDINWMLKPQLNPVFEYLVEHELTFDALVMPKHLDALYELLNRYPTLKVVIDHGAKPDIANELTPQWFEKMTLIASNTSALCKLSGLVTEAGDKPVLAKILPYMEHLLSVFGAKRLMWGSDWPVINLASDYSAWVNQVETFLAALSLEEQQAIWANNAEEFYQL